MCFPRPTLLLLLPTPRPPVVASSAQDLACQVKLLDSVVTILQNLRVMALLALDNMEPKVLGPGDAWLVKNVLDLAKHCHKVLQRACDQNETNQVRGGPLVSSVGWRTRFCLLPLQW